MYYMNAKAMKRKVFLSQIPDTATRSEVEQIFKSRLKEFNVSINKGAIEKTQVGFLGWNDDIDELEVISIFKGTDIKGGKLEMKPYDENYWKNKQQNPQLNIHPFIPKAYNNENSRTIVTVGTWMDAIATNFFSQDCFHVQLKSNAEDLESLLHDIREEIDGCTIIQSQNSAILSYVYAAPYAVDGNWYRVKVLSHIEMDKVLVEYIDYGNQETIPFSNLRILHRTLSLKPRLAFYCCLWNAEPSPFMKELEEEFKKNWLNNPCRIRIVKIQKPPRRYESEIWHVELMNSNGCNFLEEMVKRNLLKTSNSIGEHVSISNTSYSSKPASIDLNKEQGAMAMERSLSAASSEKDLNRKTLNNTKLPPMNHEHVPLSLQVNNSSVIEKSNVIVKDPIPVKILSTAPEKMEVTLRFQDIKHEHEYHTIKTALKTMYDSKLMRPLRLGPTVNLNQMYLAESSEEPNSLQRIQILRPTSSTTQEYIIPSSLFGKFVAISFIDKGSQEQKELSNGRVKDIYDMPSENDLLKCISKTDAEFVLKCPPLAKVFYLAWDRFDLELPVWNKPQLAHEMSLLLSKNNLQAKFNVHDQWIDFLYMQNERPVAWKDHLVAKGILTVSCNTDYVEDYEPVDHPEIVHITKTFQGAVYEHTGRVTYISHNAEIYIRLYDDMKNYQEIANWENVHLLSENAVSDSVQPYAVYSTLSDGKRKRFQVLHLDSENTKQVYGQFVDYGTTGWVPAKGLFTLPSTLTKVKPLAQKFVLDSCIGQVVDTNEFKTRLDEQILNTKVTVVGRKDSENSLELLTVLNGPGIRFINLYTPTSNLYALVIDLIRREYLPQVMEHSMIYRVLFSSQLKNTFSSLCGSPDVLIEAQKQSKDLKDIRRKFVETRRQLANEIETNKDAAIEDLQSLIDERQYLAESIVSLSVRGSNSLNSSADEAETKSWSDHLKEVQKALAVTQKILKVFSVGESETSSDSQFTNESPMLDFLTHETLSQLNALWRLTDQALMDLKKVTYNLTQVVSVFPPLGQNLWNIPNFGQDILMPDIRMCQYLQQWYDCLSSEVAFADQVGQCKKNEIVVSMRSLLSQLKQQHASIIEVLNNPIANVIRSAEALLQPEDITELISYLDNFPLLIRRAKAKLLRLEANIMEMDSSDAETLKELEEEEQCAKQNIQTLWLEQARTFGKIIKHCELRPELQLVHQEFRKVCKQGVVSTWDTRLIKRSQSGLRNDLFTAVFADKNVFIQEYRKVPSTVCLKTYLYGYQDICDMNQEGTFLPILAIYRSTLTDSTIDHENDSNLPFFNMMFAAPDDKLALCLNPCNTVEPEKLQHIVEDLTLANVHKLLWNALQALRQLFRSEELSAEGLPLCWLVSDNSNNDQIVEWSLRIAPPSIPVMITEDNIQINFEDKVRWNLCKFSEFLGVVNRKEFGWFNSWISDEEFSLANAAAVFGSAKPITFPSPVKEYDGVNNINNEKSLNISEQKIDKTKTISSELSKNSQENNIEEDSSKSTDSDISVD